MKLPETEEEIQELLAWLKKEGRLPNHKPWPELIAASRDELAQDDRAQLNQKGSWARFWDWCDPEPAKREPINRELENFLRQNASPMGRAFGEEIGRGLAYLVVLIFIAAVAIGGFLSLVALNFNHLAN